MLTDSRPTNASFDIICSPTSDASTSDTKTSDRNTSDVVPVREATGKPQIVRKPSDWMVGSRASLVQHAPTKTVFEIFARPDLGQDDSLTLEDFRARLVHRGPGKKPFTDTDLEMLRGEAVLMALFLVGLAWPLAVNPN